MMRVQFDDLFALAPDAAEVYVRGLGCLPAVMACFGIWQSELRVSHFLAQVLHESGGLQFIEENLNYRAERIAEVWPARFPTLESAQPYARNPQALAERVYGGRKELGNLSAGDGWTYRGRGPIQITGRHNYRVLGLHLDLDLVEQPDLAIAPDYVWPVACAAWRQRQASRWADRDDIRAVTRAINGGLHSLAARRIWFDKVRPLVVSA